MKLFANKYLYSVQPNIYFVMSWTENCVPDIVVDIAIDKERERERIKFKHIKV